MLKRSADSIAVNIIARIFIGLLGLLAVIPFIMLISSSLQSEENILKFGFSLFPREITGDAYSYIFAYPEKIMQSYGVTIFITLAGTIGAVFFISMTAYVLYRKDLKYRNSIAFFLFFTTIFSGGLVPSYILMVRYLQLKDNLLTLIFPGLFSVFYILIARNYMSGAVPDSLPESAKVDGANDFVIYTKIVFPLLKPVLASIGLFTALNYWNDWWTAMLYIESSEKMPLQYVLYRLLSKSNMAAELVTKAGGVADFNMPKETLKLAMTVVATGPIVLVYPFVQKYFVSGITLGAVKG